MNNTRFSLVVIPTVLLINTVALAVVYFIPWKHNYIPTSTETIKCVIFSGVLSLLLKLLNNFKIMFKISDHNVFNSHFQPIVKEFVKFIIISFIALHQTGDGTWVSRLTLWQVLLMLLVFTVVTTWEFVYEFMPYFYYRNNEIFLKLCDDFNYMENYDDGLKNDVAIKIVESLKRGQSMDSCDSDETLAGILPKKISVADIQDDYLHAIDQNSPDRSTSPLLHPYDLKGNFPHETSRFPCGHIHTADNVTQAESFNFDQNLFTSSPKFDRKLSIATLPRSITTPRSANKNKPCYNLVDRLYSVSPRNTFHLITASATAVMKSDLPMFNDDTEVNGNDIDASPFIDDGSVQVEHEVSANVDDDLDNVSVHTTDTDFGGGGGGGFKYTFPDGSKIKFGGGGGWGYNHKHKHKKHSISSSSKSTISSCKSSKNISERNPRNKWLSWLIPISKKKDSIKKKLSTFQFEPRTPVPQHESCSIKSSLVTCAQNNFNDYHSIAEEALGDDDNQSVQKFQINKEDFTNYVNVSLGLDRYRLVFDPVFERFNYRIIRDLTLLEVVLCFLNKLVWIFGSILVYSTIYLNDNINFLVLVIVLKLFNINMINRSEMCLKKMLTIKIILNISVFSALVVL